jgi:hypothetical protein
MNPLTKNLMSFNTYMIHLKKKKNLSVLDQFFFAIKEEKYNEVSLKKLIIFNFYIQVGRINVKLSQYID